jgi:hypothetical protein
MCFSLKTVFLFWNNRYLKSIDNMGKAAGFSRDPC